MIAGKNDFSFLELPKVNVNNTVGAGDSFTAVLISGLLKGIRLVQIYELATRTAAYVCAREGACPVVPFRIF